MASNMGTSLKKVSKYRSPVELGFRMTIYNTERAVAVRSFN